jgi:hypothetical protein
MPQANFSIAANKRRQLSALERFEPALRLYLRGDSIADIERSTGIPRSTISRNLRKVREEWLRRFALEIGAERLHEVETLRWQRAMLWQDYERSRGRKTVVSRRIGGPAADGKVQTHTMEVEETTHAEGDPRILDAISKLSSQIAALLGSNRSQENGQGSSVLLPPGTQGVVAFQPQPLPELPWASKDDGEALVIEAQDVP